MAKVRAVPEGFSSVTAHLVVKGAADATEFYKKAFGAQELVRHPLLDGSGRLMHAMVQIGNSRVMLADDFPEWGGSRHPGTLGGTPVSLHLFVEDADAAFQQAVAAGATVTMPLADMFWGDRYGTVTDPFGHVWSIATHVRDVTPEEIAQAMAAMGGGH